MTEEPPRRRPQQRKQMLLRLDPAVHDALARWAGDELRSANAHVEFLLRRALADAGRLPGGVGAIPRRGRPPKSATGSADPPGACDRPGADGRGGAPDPAEAPDPPGPRYQPGPNDPNRTEISDTSEGTGRGT
ncbi:hypothetical protein AAHZ94_16370 [Streptomyces sp. HSW2009]|uniref:hypothetical protein n=1 Tax=Streptomyces sp. HSW2009 TaxID=3142890 RepID=UPI0032F06BD6